MERYRILPNLQLDDLRDQDRLNYIFQDMGQDYYWSSDFSPQFYSAQAKAGFMAVTEVHRGEELLLPELQKSYAVLKLENLHIGRKIKKMLSDNRYSLHIGFDLESVREYIGSHHKQSWLTPRYIETLREVNELKDGILVVSVMLKYQGVVTAGEIGYMIGSTYTSLSGFSSRAPHHKSHGTLQLVMLGQKLQKYGFEIWNLGQPYMPYKFALGAQEYPRDKFLELWKTHTNKPHNI